MRTFFAFLLVLCVFDAAFAECPSGYSDVTALYAQTFSPKSRGVCPSGYESYTAPSVIDIKFNGILLETAPTVCDADSHYENGVCTPNTQGNCSSGFFTYSSDDSTFFPKVNNSCPTGYGAYTAPSVLDIRFNGVLLPTAPTVCSTGHYVAGVCSAYSAGDCMTGYVDMGADDIVAAVNSGGTCPSGYTAMGSFQSCNVETTSNFCTSLCNGGKVLTPSGYCVNECGLGISQLNVGANTTYPLYGVRLTTPSLAIGNGVNQCYLNLGTGAGTGVKVLYNNTVYHVTD